MGRWIYESLARFTGRQEWLAAKRRGENPGPWPAFLEKYREHLPPEVETLAWREKDIWGPYDYANKPAALEWLAGKPLGRAIVPYPTWYYKLFTHTYRTIAADPIMGWRNYADLLGPGRSVDQRRQAAANMLTGVIITGLVWSMIPDAWDEQEQYLTGTERALYSVTGRLKVPLYRSPTGEELWLRVLDMPILGDILAAKAMTRGHLTFDDYWNDRMSVGPLALALMYMKGWRSKYSMNQPTSALMGQLATGVMPFSPALQLGRRLADPYKRRTYRRDAGALENFARGLASEMPGASRLLDVAHSTIPPHLPLRYPRASEATKFFVWNVRAIRPGERRQALREAYQRHLEQERKKLIAPR